MHVWTCVFVFACVWRPEGNVGCNALRCHSFCHLRQGLSLSWNSLIWLGSWPVSSRDPFRSSQVRDYKHTILLNFFMWILGTELMSLCLQGRHFQWLRCLPGPLCRSLFPFIMRMYMSAWMCILTYVSALVWVDVCRSLKLVLDFFFDHFLLYRPRQGLGIEHRAHWFSKSS